MKAKKVLELTGIHRATLSRYVKEGKIRVTPLPNKTYSYNEDDVYSILGVEKKRKNVIYARVSTYKQKVDLANQEQVIEEYMNKNGVRVDKIYNDIKSGMTLDRKGFMKLLNDVQSNEIDTVYISYKDRLARLSYELVVKLFNKSNTRIHIVNQAVKSDEQELFEDLMQVIHGFSMKMYSKKRFAKKLLKGEENEATKS
jgi:predicted site-specific integrase-resolvase